MTENVTKKMICHPCGVEMVPKKTNFQYLGHTFFTDVLRCPECGQVYIPEELVRDRMVAVEMQLEDK